MELAPARAVLFTVLYNHLMGSGRGKARRTQAHASTVRPRPYKIELTSDHSFMKNYRQLHEPTILVGDSGDEDAAGWSNSLAVFLDLDTDHLVLIRVETPPTGAGDTTY